MEAALQGRSEEDIEQFSKKLSGEL